MGSPDASNNGLPLPLTRQLDELCDDFERQLNASGKINFAPYLKRVDSAGHQYLLNELIAMATDHLRSQGNAKPEATILQENPNVADKINAVFSNLNDQVATALHQPNTIDHPRPHSTSRRKKSRGLQIRCPHCSNHIALVSDAPLDSVDCTLCGSNFSLIDGSKETRMAETLKRIDRFELVSRLGVGGFGTVWKARDTDLDRVVAIKIPRYSQLSEEEMEQFFREARSVAQLRHPNIVPVHEVGREGDAVFIVSDLIRGVSLADRLTGNRPSFREVAQLGITIASGLDHAHRCGVIHRDLKPANVMIDDVGEPHLMDFGLAKREAEEVTMTVDGQILGTPAYMSPEQADGKSAWVDRRTDVYSLGVILFEMLTGELPFRGNAQLQVHQRLNDDAPSANSLNKQIPQDLVTICAKCLEREPGRRYQTAKDVQEELVRYLDNLPIKARPLSLFERTIRWAGRRPLQATIAALVSFLAIVGPTVAVVIERQKATLRDLVSEKGKLIELLEQERQSAIAQATTLQTELDVWEGRANPSEFWPPAADFPPQRRQLAALLASRRAVLEQPPTQKDESELSRAKRLIALATLHEAASRSAEAVSVLQGAVQALELELAANPNSIPFSLALADVYHRLSGLVASDNRSDSMKWLGLARKTLQQAAKVAPLNPQVLALLQDMELRSSLATGFEDTAEEFVMAARMGLRLKGLWPKSTEEIYQLVCELAGRPAYLTKLPAADASGVIAPEN